MQPSVMTNPAIVTRAKTIRNSAGKEIFIFLSSLRCGNAVNTGRVRLQRIATKPRLYRFGGPDRKPKVRLGSTAGTVRKLTVNGFCTPRGRSGNRDHGGILANSATWTTELVVNR